MFKSKKTKALVIGGVIAGVVIAGGGTALAYVLAHGNGSTAVASTPAANLNSADVTASVPNGTLLVPGDTPTTVTVVIHNKNPHTSISVGAVSLSVVLTPAQVNAGLVASDYMFVNPTFTGATIAPDLDPLHPNATDVTVTGTLQLADSSAHDQTAELDTSVSIKAAV